MSKRGANPGEYDQGDHVTPGAGASDYGADLTPGAGASDYGADLSPGQAVGDYVIREQIGRGGCSTVYRAQRASDGLPVAIKVLHPFLAASPEQVQRFLREASTLQRVEHPSILRVHDAGHFADNRPYLVTEFVDGVNLKRYVQAHGRLSPAEAVSLIAPICLALSCAHEAGIVHRDVKPSNVMIGIAGTSRPVKLLDFGIAKLVESDGESSSDTAPNTSVGVLLGSVHSMAPEQILGLAVDPRTDIYALGVLAYVMLTGSRPFDGPDELTITQMHLYVDPRNPSDLAPVPPSVDAVLLRALAKSADQRYPSALSFCQALRDALGHSDAVTRDGRAVAIYVEGRADAAAADIDDAVLVDFVTIVDIAACELEQAGMQVLFHTAQAVVAALVLRDGAAGERARVLEVATRVHDELASRSGADERVHVNVYVHEADAEVSDAHGVVEVCGGPIADVDRWAPQRNVDGVAVDRAVTRALQGADIHG